MSGQTGDKPGEKTVIAVFPSVFSLNKMDILEKNIAGILKIKKHGFARIRRNDSLIIVEADDPVLASATISSLFGVDSVAIAREVASGFGAAVDAIAATGATLLLRGDTFYVKVGGKSPDYLGKDLEVAATAALIERTANLNAKAGSEASHGRLLYTHVTKSHTYVCIFVDRGLGGVPYNCQGEGMVCCIFDELSAISCLQSIKMGFDVMMVICYSNDSDLLKISKMVNRMLSSVVRERITLHFCKTGRIQDPLKRILGKTLLATSVAKSMGKRHVSLPVLPFAHPSWLVEENLKAVTKDGLVPWLPLSGMDSSIIENSKQLGLEKYIASLEGLCKTRFARKRAPMVKLRAQARDAVRGLKAVTITAGPKSVYEMIDSVRTNH